MKCKFYKIINTLVFLVVTVQGQLSGLKPGDVAKSFTLQTLDGRIVYMAKKKNKTTARHPIIFHAFTNRSAFLEALWTDLGSVEGLLRDSPQNTRYVFMSLSDDARTDAMGMKKLLHRAIDQYFNRSDHQAKSNDSRHDSCTDPIIIKHKDTKQEIHEKESLRKLSEIIKERKYRSRHHDRKRPNNHKYCNISPADLWKERLHFVSLPVYKLGNWIPFVLNRWKCFGSGCALAQVAFKSKIGDVVHVSARLDARYDWLPSPHMTAHKHTNFRVKDYGDACQPQDNEDNEKGNSEEDLKETEEKEKEVENEESEDFKARYKRGTKKKKKHKSLGKVALVSAAGNCSIYQKLRHMSRAKVDAVLIYQVRGRPVQELSCTGRHCFLPLRISASMIPHEDGLAIRKLLDEDKKIHATYQYTPQENYFMAIDGQGKLAEVGLFLYPSMMFMGYEARWFNYKTDLIHNLTGSAKIIRVFDHALMKGRTGAVVNITMPPFEDLQLYRNVELDLSLHCGAESDYDCPHWDHVVQLTVCCEKESPLCGEELGRWITPYRRKIGRWLTPITPLLPLFAESRHCTLVMKHPFWERSWRPSLNIRLSDHIHYSKHHYSGQKEDEFIVPYKIKKLFEGGKFDKKYNTRYKPIKFQVPEQVERVKLVATITGHGSDNHGCAEFCITSHHFIVNGKPNVKVFKNAATARGCAERVDEGVVPNEHGTWLYGRNGWCPGQDVVPWVVDITGQITRSAENTIKYYGWFNGTDPKPKRDTGSILMNSFLVFYKLDDKKSAR